MTDTEHSHLVTRIKLDVPLWLADETFEVEHCPNCPSPFKVRLVQWGRGRIDGTEGDAIGHGSTLEEAAKKARIQRDAVKALAIARANGVSIPSSAVPTSGDGNAD